MSVTAPQELCKQPAEKRKYGMEFFHLLLTSSETLSSIQSITSEKIGGGTSDLAITNSGIANGLGTSSKVTLWIASGTHGNTYRVEIQTITTGGQTLEGDGIIRVKDK